MTKDERARAEQKLANKIANEMMREDGLDPVKDQSQRPDYYARAQARIRDIGQRVVELKDS